MNSRHDDYLANVDKRANRFTAKLMSNSKWLKLFKLLAANNSIVGEIVVVDIYDDIARQLKIPATGKFSYTFHDRGVKDVTTGGPYLFKEIRWIDVPSSPEIENLLRSIGELVIEHHENCIRIYGYR